MNSSSEMKVLFVSIEHIQLVQDSKRNFLCIHFLIQFNMLSENYSFFLIFLVFDFTASQDYFTHLESSQSLSGAKTGDPQERPPDHPQAELGLSHM